MAVDGQPVYTGKGSLVSKYTIGDGDSFAVDSSKSDEYIYLWLPIGTTHNITVDGTEIASDVSDSTVENVVVTAKASGDRFAIKILDNSFAMGPNGESIEYAVTVELYDDTDNMIQSVSENASLESEKDIVNITADKASEASYFKVLICDKDSMEPIIDEGVFYLQ